MYHKVPSMIISGIYTQTDDVLLTSFSDNASITKYKFNRTDNSFDSDIIISYYERYI